MISQSYGSGGGGTLLWAADDAAVQAGVTVVASSGDEGFDNTFITPADDPDVIGVGGSTDMRLLAQAYDYSGWVDDNIATLSSTGVGQPFSMPTAPGKLVDLVAPGYGGEAACSPLVTSSCPTNALTEAFGGTSQSAPYVAGAAADVIEAYSNTHNGTRPTPALVQQILDGTARDIAAPAGEQGAGIVDIYAAVRAAEQEPGTTLGKPDLKSSQGLVSSPTQIDVSGAGGTSVPSQLNIYNASAKATKVTATLKQLGPAKQVGSTVTEQVSAPDPSLPVPSKGATAAAPITFNVPAGTDRINANMIWPDPTNGNTLYYILTDPQGKLVADLLRLRHRIDPSGASGHGARHPAHRGLGPDSGNVDRDDPVGQWPCAPAGAAERARHVHRIDVVPGHQAELCDVQARGRLGQDPGPVDRAADGRGAAGERSGRSQPVGAAVGCQRRRLVCPGAGPDLDPAGRWPVLGDDGDERRPQSGFAELAVLHRRARRSAVDERLVQHG